MTNNNNIKEIAAVMNAACVTESKVADAVSKTHMDKAVYAVNRVYRLHEAPTISDVELGEAEIKRIAREAVTASVKRICFIATVIRKKYGVNIVPVFRSENGSIKRVEEMNIKEKMAIFSEYEKLSWLIEQAAEETAK